jgi:hypothetical protein
MNGPQRYNYDELREEINTALLNKNMPEKLYQSADGIMRIMNAIVKTKGEGWTAQVLNSEGKPLLTQPEQQRFSEAFKPHINTIIEYFGDDNNDTSLITEGGAYKPDISKLSGMSSDFLKTKVEQATHSFPKLPFDPTKMPGVDDIYSKVVNRIGNVNSVVNDYASKYGVLKLEKEHDLEPDIRMIPQPAALAISEGLFALSSAAGVPILPQVSLEVLSKLKVPFRTIVFTIYLALDVARIAMGVSGPPIGRKIMSILLSILELLRGDWKKAILTFVGYYGMTPMLVGELLKVFMTMFRMLAPQIQESIIFGSLDAAKSLVIGLLLAIFQVTAPEEVRLPLIGVLEKIAQTKAQMDGTLEDIGLSARPDYLAPTWNDLNNIQAVMSDEGYICSCEFEQLVKAVNDAPIINIVLQILRIPVNKDMITYKCGNGPCTDFTATIVKEAKEDTDKTEKAKEPFSMKDFGMSPDLNPLTSITAPVQKATQDITQDISDKATKEISDKATSALTGAITGALSPLKTKSEESGELKESEKPEEQKSSNIKVGGRILHSRKQRQQIIA